VELERCCTILIQNKDPSFVSACRNGGPQQGRSRSGGECCWRLGRQNEYFKWKRSALKKF